MPNDQEEQESSPSLDEPTRPYSLAPLSAPGEVEPDDEAPASVWTGVWDRKWTLFGASVVAFCGALVVGRFTAARHSMMVDPAAVSAATAVPSAVAMPPEARNDAPISPDPSSTAADTATPPSGPEESSGASEAETETPTAGASHSKPRVRSYARSRAAAPTQGKRFMPNQI